MAKNGHSGKVFEKQHVSLKYLAFLAKNHVTSLSEFFEFVSICICAVERAKVRALAF